MTDREQTDAFSKEIWKVIDHFRAEYDLTVAQAVGVLQIVVVLLTVQNYEDQKEDEEEKSDGGS